MKKNLFVSFSGGETSAYMGNLILNKYRPLFKEIVFGFANTGQENEQTLEFVDRCDKAFGFGVHWIEAEPARGKNLQTHRIVSFETASRVGAPFEKAIKLYGIPNVDFPMCTRELKTRPMLSFIRSLGWKNGGYLTAIGIRADESKRRAKGHVENGIIYPLLDAQPTTKPQINTFWRDQPFRLELAGYQGNCKTCWKKSTRKLLTVMDENAGAFDFFERMEAENSFIGPEFSKLEKYDSGYRRTFLRKYISIKDLRKIHEAQPESWQRAENDAVIYNDQQIALDLDEGCVESCEVNWE